jgi:hypothetical protein
MEFGILHRSINRQKKALYPSSENGKRDMEASLNQSFNVFHVIFHCIELPMLSVSILISTSRKVSNPRSTPFFSPSLSFR